ncbi:MAG: M28 family peptidase [Nocardiaceae bacterium]|nr:M28 family peptidase [Nocardiaceae bacterium]
MRARFLCAIALLIAALTSGCSQHNKPAHPVPTNNPALSWNFDELAKRPAVSSEPASLAAAVNSPAVWQHLEQFQRIADASDGNRAAGTAGYDRSVDYVQGMLKARGFDVEVQEFEYDFIHVKSATMTVGGRTIQPQILQGSMGTSASGITARLQPLSPGLKGCSEDEYAGIDVRGTIVLVDRGDCPFRQKEAVAHDVGALAVLVANSKDVNDAARGQEEPHFLPIVMLAKRDAETLRASPGEVTLIVDAPRQVIKTRNVFTQTTTGDPHEVVVLGGHLDSVREGPGINDNGSGSATVLETALALGPHPDLKNAVRFMFFGAEEDGLIGSEKYVKSLSRNAQLDIALMLNADMIASPNPGYFVYNDATEGSDTAPAGSESIRAAFTDRLRGQGITVAGFPFNSRSDYGPFLDAGIPVGGLATGDNALKTGEEAQAWGWGGTPDTAFDPNYHQPGDTLDNIDKDALGRNAGAFAYLVGLFGHTLDGEYAVPKRTERAPA